MASMEDLLATQEQLYGAIENLYSNFKKDGSERKTAEYIKRRTDTLDSYWAEYNSNHNKLCGFGIKSHSYFTSNQFESVREYYSKIRAIIQNYLIREESRPPTPLLKPATPLGVSRAVTSRVEEMLRKQQSNFKAFRRTLSAIDLDSLSEKWEFEDIQKSVQSRWTAIDVLHWEIDSELLQEDEEYEKTFSMYEKKYNDVKKSISSKIWSQDYREKSTPVIDIPTFSGNYHHWISFKDLFSEAIHNNRSLSNAQKLQFLKSKLKGEAEKLIQHLHISSENYQISWDILNHRYNNVKLILNAHLHIFMNLPTLQQQSFSAIKKIHDTTNECLNAIKNLGVDISTWDPIIVYVLTQKLDADTHSEYVESLKNPREVPSLRELLEFLETKFTSLEASKRRPETSKPSQKEIPQIKKPHNYNSLSTNKNNHNSNKTFKRLSCPVCSKNHAIFKCITFLQFQPDIKRNTVKQLSLCKNCLYNHEDKLVCPSKKRCNNCGGEHNTLLHDAFGIHQSASIISNTTPHSLQSQQISTNVLTGHSGEILLATALVKVQAVDGTFHIMRALIDQGSQTSLISENAAQILNLPRKRCKGIIFGIGAKENGCKGMTTLSISSRYNDDFIFQADVFIMKHLVNNLPNKSFGKPSWSYIENLQLADPEFYKSRSIDILLGAETYSSIIQGGVIKDTDSMPVAQQTRLGWILCGNVQSFQCNVVSINVEDIQNFWAIEDIKEDSILSEEDQKCVDFYESTTTRHSDGRYVVRLPMHPEAEKKLGESKLKAVAQFYQLEKKFKKQDNIAKDYKLFINEYIALNHMQLTLGNSTPSYYMPHHCVQRADSATTALRVVFNASQKTSTGVSLNDIMYRGPNLQKDLLSLILKWRQYQYAFTADIEKMFRQIMVHPDDQHFQKIVWRDNPEESLKDYQLSTVTYGTKSAPFLAMMTLRRLAHDERHMFPVAAKVLEEQFYMDDLLGGSFSISSAKLLQNNLIKLLKAGGFNLRKWSSNATQLVEDQDNFNFKHPESTKALGLTWNAKEDTFVFQCKMTKQTSLRHTKRSLLAEISKLFDPLGWLSPVVVQLKLLFQNVWLIDLKWDDKVPDNIHSEWIKLRSDVENINQIIIPRWIGCGEMDIIQLHGFCDASTKAYACVVYARISRQEQVFISLIAAKTKLVPIIKTKEKDTKVSLPRLELCGAHLLSKLMAKVIQSLNVHTTEIYGWCDSTAVLGWLQGEPSKWKPFVANRVKKITAIMTSSCWRYVKSNENPADCASRGVCVKQLLENSLWWNGPSWLSSPIQSSQFEENIYTTDFETKKCSLFIVATQYTDNNIIQILINKYSSFTRVTRVLAWILRAISRNKVQGSYLSVQELQYAKLKIIKYVQAEQFSEEIHDLQRQGKVRPKSRLLQFNPFLDKNGLLRVGGRLRNSHISEEMKHPLIIPHDTRVTELLIDQGHKSTFHGGTRLTLSWLRQTYWILGGNRAVKKRLRSCVLCRKHNPTKLCQLMGDLPDARTNPSRPFHHTAVDFTGFVDIKANKGRGVKTSKGYVAVFVCMATKAVHLELVSDLSSSSFLAALRRLSARRGAPRHMYSDNGTNFVGANKVLSKEFFNLKSITSEEFHSEISEMNIEWHFNAPSWPSAGGLWESAVKSLKYHLKRVIGDQKLTYEEFSTILTQLESCLNSRPLCAISEDPDDINYLTPSHFLASGPLLTIIETEKDERTRWQLAQKIFQDIWKRWRSEYLSQLSSRSKWQQSQQNMKLDDIVIIHDANIPAGKWALGRVIDLHPGKDGYVRVVSVKTKNGTLKRPIIKLSVLPVRSEDQNNAIIQKPSSITCDNQEKTVPSKRVSSFNIISNILLLFMLFLYSVEGAYNISRYHGQKGLYFDKISNMRLIQDQWKIVVYYDMQPYWQGSRVFNVYMTHLETLCNQEQRKSHCDVVMLQLRHGFMELEYYDGMLLNQHFEARTRSRSRRGLIDGVGYIAHSLFGVLDQHFAEQYQRDITLIRNNEKYLGYLWKNQTSIIEAENNLLKRVESNMEKQYKIFNQHLLNLEHSVSTLKNKVQDVFNTEEFILSTIIANNILTTLRNIQETLLDAITSVKHFNIHLISPSQLQEELNIISSQIPRDLSLPIDNIITDLHKFYQIMQVRARMTHDYFIFEIQIPLVNRETYDMYRIISIPIQLKDKMVKIVPISDYLAFNLKKDTFLPISQEELHKCVQYDSITKLCSIQNPEYRRNSDGDICQKDQKNNLCSTISTQCVDTWMELFKVNNFILSCCNARTLRIICNQQMSTEQIAGVNIIALGNDCILRSDTFTIHAHRQQGVEVNVKPTIIAPDIAPINNIINIQIPIHETQINETSLSESIQNISRKIKNIQQASGELDDFKDTTMSYHDVHHYVAIYCVAAGGLAFGAWLWLRSLRRRTTNSSTIPVQNSVVQNNQVDNFSETRQQPCHTDRGCSPVLIKCRFSDPNQ